MKLKKIHRVLAFQQSQWLKPYIDFNTQKRKEAKNEFEKDFYKLMNNSVFGKTLENIRHHVNVELICTQERFRKVLAKPNMNSFSIFDENLATVQLKNTELTLNRPVFVGMSILDISKTVMYDFLYNFIKPKYGDKAQLAFTDTDSFCFEIQTEDIYRDMKENSDLFYTSNFPVDHPIYSNVNKKVVGKFKDECPKFPIREFIGLKPKMYSLDLGVEEKKVAKGVSRPVIRKELRHEFYKNCLFKKRAMKQNMHLIRSKKHQIETIRINKTTLTPYDDKRYFLNEYKSFAHGHYRIREHQMLA